MPRLRVSTALSLFALLIGVAGTQWLCTMTDDWVGPPARRVVVTTAHRSRVVRPQRRSHAAPQVVGAWSERAASPVAATAPPQSLVPLSTPPDPTPYVRLRGHLDGFVIVEISTDGAGHVRSADIAQSSGDAVLDAHALATVRRWRFAVAAGGEGVRGRLPMRFDSSAPSTPP